MSSMKKYRIAGLAAGILVLLVSGMVYSWSVLSAPIAAEYPAWSKAQLSLTFTLVMFMFCIGCTLGGLLADRVKPGTIVLCSAVLFPIGLFLSAGARSLAGLYIGFGVLCGFASGFSYNAVLSTVTKWFPGKTGLISGVLLMGFGFSSFLIGLAYQFFTPGSVGAWRSSFRFMGVVMAAVLVLCSFFIRRPDPGTADAQAPAGKRKQFVEPGATELSTGEMMKKAPFWFGFAWAVLLSAAGVGIVSQASAITREAGPLLQSGTVAVIVGMMSVFNGAARTALGFLFDRRGRSLGMLLVGALFVVCSPVLFLAVRLQSPVLVTIGFILAGIGHGGVSTTVAYFVRACYGSRHYPNNLSVIVSHLLIASFGSTVSGALYDRSGNYTGTFVMIAVCGILSLLLNAGIGACYRRAERKVP